MKTIRELLPGVFVLKPQTFDDPRGSLTVPFHTVGIQKCIGQPFIVSQTIRSVSAKYVLRGLHYQDDTAPVAKLISCWRGAIFDVVVDLRRESKGFGSWVSIELSAKNGLQLYVPAGLAHGYLSLTESEVFYHQEGLFSSDASHILAWDDPDLGIEWPGRPMAEYILSDRDRTQGRSLQDYKNHLILLARGEF